jgi:hypothetical protein
LLRELGASAPLAVAEEVRAILAQEARSTARPSVRVPPRDLLPVSELPRRLEVLLQRADDAGVEDARGTMDRALASGDPGAARKAELDVLRAVGERS